MQPAIPPEWTSLAFKYFSLSQHTNTKKYLKNINLAEDYLESREEQKQFNCSPVLSCSAAVDE